MQDNINTGKGRKNLRTKKVMGIRYDSEFHCNFFLYIMRLLYQDALQMVDLMLNDPGGKAVTGSGSGPA